MNANDVWSRVYWKWRRRGCDANDAAYRADEAVKRLRRAPTVSGKPE